jgi:hypothetical protein
LDEKKKYLDRHWILARNELNEEKLLRTKLETETKLEFDRALSEEKDRCNRAMRDNDERNAEVKKAHATQCDELCREILKANLEADHLHSQLNNGDSKPRKARLFSDGKPEPGPGPMPLVLVVVSMGVITVSRSVRDMGSIVFLLTSRVRIVSCYFEKGIKAYYGAVLGETTGTAGSS